MGNGMCISNFWIDWNRLRTHISRKIECAEGMLTFNRFLRTVICVPLIVWILGAPILSSIYVVPVFVVALAINMRMGAVCAPLNIVIYKHDPIPLMLSASLLNIPVGYLLARELPNIWVYPIFLVEFLVLVYLIATSTTPKVANILAMIYSGMGKVSNSVTYLYKITNIVIMISTGMNSMKYRSSWRSTLYCWQSWLLIAVGLVIDIVCAATPFWLSPEDIVIFYSAASLEPIIIRLVSVKDLNKEDVIVTVTLTLVFCAILIALKFIK